MAPTYDQVLKVCEVLSENESLPITLKQTAKGVGITGTGAAIGGLVAGPPGLFLGGSIASGIAYLFTRNTFKSVPYIIKYELNNEQKRRLVASVNEILQSFRAEDYVAILAILNANPAMKYAVLAKIKDFIVTNVNV